jgi:hypothetical protein
LGLKEEYRWGHVYDFVNHKGKESHAPQGEANPNGDSGENNANKVVKVTEGCVTDSAAGKGDCELATPGKQTSDCLEGCATGTNAKGSAADGCAGQESEHRRVVSLIPIVCVSVCVCVCMCVCVIRM